MGTAIMMVATTAGGNENALASIDSPMTGNLIGVEWSGYADFDTDNDFLAFQLSFGSASTVQNDSRQVISMCSLGWDTISTAVGHAIGKVDRYAKIPDIPIGMGERLYIHSRAAAGVVATVFCLLHFDFDLDKVQVRRR